MNQIKILAELDIYTLIPLIGKMKSRLNDGRNIFSGSLSASEVEVE